MVITMADVKEEEFQKAAEKKLKSRINKFKRVSKKPEDKEKFFDQLGASVEIFLPTKKPEEMSDSIIFYTTVEGKIVDAEYSYFDVEYESTEENGFKSIPIEEKQLKVLMDAFADSFHLDYLDE